jgi:hypothetical protein
MASIPLALESSNLPLWLLTPHAVVTKCKQHGHGPSGFAEYSPDRTESVWIKYGPCVTMGEARTQDFIAKIVNSSEGYNVRVSNVFYAFRYEDIGYILMQHIPGQDCSTDDLDQIVLAVKQLLSIDSPTATPGPVGGGPIGHRFFDEHQSNVQYVSVGELQEHINNVSDSFKSSRQVVTRSNLDSPLGRVSMQDRLQPGRWDSQTLHRRHPPWQFPERYKRPAVCPGFRQDKLPPFRFSGPFLHRCISKNIISS